jgi:hypothetical protein
MPLRAASRFGNFDRLNPPSLQPVDVTKWKRREVPTEIERPPYAESGEPSEWDGHITILDQIGIDKMTTAGDLARRVLDMGGKLCQVRPHAGQHCQFNTLTAVSNTSFPAWDHNRFH